MSGDVEKRILEANSRYASTYNPTGLIIQPANKLVISKIILFATNIYRGEVSCL